MFLKKFYSIQYIIINCIFLLLFCYVLFLLKVIIFKNDNNLKTINIYAVSIYRIIKEKALIVNL